ncbi:ribosome biogenesis GTPase A [Clostridia bacterium]|nr:ribosome biogenesis GTPase A [Clostridia bacterium]
MAIQWYPGHMAKTKRLITENLHLVDVVIELLDARIPISSKNPDIDSIAGHKPKIVLLNKADLANDNANAAWQAYFKERGVTAVLVNSTSGKGLAEITKSAEYLTGEKVRREEAKGRRNVTIRAMIVGIPNVGKSTLINKYAGRDVAKAENRPGVTKSKQWVKIKKNFELLDSPGILWHKFDDEATGIKLACTGAIKDDILDIYTLSLRLLEILVKNAPDELAARYKIEIIKGEHAEETLERIAKARGFVKRGGVPDTDRAATILIDEFRGAKIGKISLEYPADFTTV